MSIAEPTRWLDDAEISAWVRLITVVELLPGVLDGQLQREAGLTHFEYFVLAMLSEAPEQTLRMTRLAARTNATVSRLSHVVSRLERQGYVERRPCPDDGRATNAVLTPAGRDKIVATAPGHVATVRAAVIDVLTPEQIGQLESIMAAIMARLDPLGAMSSDYVRDARG